MVPVGAAQVLHADTTSAEFPLGTSALDALASIGDRYAVIGLKQLMAGIELGDLTLPSLVAGALRRRGAQRYLDLRARSELDDFSPRVRARAKCATLPVEQTSAIVR